MIGLIASTFDLAGKVLLGAAVILVHRKMMQEHRIDRVVVKEIRLEEFLTALGILLMVSGYVLRWVF